MPRAPLDKIKVTPHGGYGYVRTGPGEGACREYPCTHPGVDLAAVEGTEVFAPDSGQLVAVSLGDGPPFSGYNPGVVVLETEPAAGNEWPSWGWWTEGLAHDRRTAKPRLWHLMAHLSGQDLESRWGLFALGEKRVPVAEGDVIGKVSGVRHVHWEVRQKKATATGKDRTDPVQWLAKYGGVGRAAEVWTAPRGEEPGSMVFLVLAFLLSQQKDQK